MIPFGRIPLFSSLEDAFKWFLTRIHETTGLPWAWSIIVLTILVRLALVPLFVKQMKSSQQMQAIAPKIKALQVKHKGDRKKLQEEQMKLYQEHSVNPFGACLPLVFQMPVFFALYLVLRSFSKHPPGGQAAIDRGDFAFLGSFIPNITLATDKVGFAGIVLIVLYVASQAASTLLMPNTMDPRQRYMFLALPFLFVIFVIRFPVGLMLYWITTNLWTVGQQTVLRKLMPVPTLPPSSNAQKGGSAKGGGGSTKGGGGSTKGGGGSTKGGGGSTKGGGTPKGGGGGNSNGRSTKPRRPSPTRGKS
jgi:YidC/Oxa1 family membrane protein insertase